MSTRAPSPALSKIGQSTNRDIPGLSSFTQVKPWIVVVVREVVLMSVSFYISRGRKNKNFGYFDFPNFIAK